MEPSHLLKYLEDNYPISPQQFDSLQYKITEHFYFFGNHFRNPRELSKQEHNLSIRKHLRDLFILFKIVNRSKIQNNKKTILSSSYFSVNNELKKLEYNVYCPSWGITEDRDVLTSFKILKASNNIIKQFSTQSFNELLDKDFLAELVSFEKMLKAFFVNNKINSVVVPADVEYFSNISIRVSKEINIPSFIFLHGLPHAIKNCDYNRSDYLIVWGNRTKEHYIRNGMDANKIFVSGHPSFKSFKEQELKFDFDNIVVLTKSVSGTDFGDRANSILYLHSVEKILKKNGIKNAKVRPHPGENPNWYMNFINTDFYKIDTDKNIKNASLVIGPTSSVFLESIYYGINYIVYEPIVNNLDFTGCMLLSPFDGSDEKVPVANTENEFDYIMRNKIRVDSSCFSEYCKVSFDMSFIKKLI